jgi:hypothetical protein
MGAKKERATDNCVGKSNGHGNSDRDGDGNDNGKGKWNIDSNSNGNSHKSGKVVGDCEGDST